MIEQHTILDQWMGTYTFQKLMDNLDDYEDLYEKRFGLSDIDISARALSHWKELGLLPTQLDKDVVESGEQIQEGGQVRRKHARFNFFELIFLYVMLDLREIGFSLKKMKKVRDILLHEIDLFKIIENLTQKDIISFKKNGFDTPIIEDLIEKINELSELKDAWPEELHQMPALFPFILGIIMGKMNATLVFLKNGNVQFDLLNKNGQSDNQYYKNQPHIVIPINNYLLRFISHERYKDLLVPYKLIDDQEMLILDKVRSGEYKEIKIRFDKRNSITLELTQEKKIENAARLSEILLKKGYQELIVKTEVGTIKYGTITTKIKLPKK